MVFNRYRVAILFSIPVEGRPVERNGKIFGWRVAAVRADPRVDGASGDGAGGSYKHEPFRKISTQTTQRRTRPQRQRPKERNKIIAGLGSLK